MRGLAINFTSTHRVGNSAGISKVGENKQLLIAIVAHSYFSGVSLNSVRLFPPIPISEKLVSTSIIPSYDIQYPFSKSNSAVALWDILINVFLSALSFENIAIIPFPKSPETNSLISYSITAIFFPLFLLMSLSLATFFL
ncbi:MAG: hypothetical protein CL818_11470 [Croceibacter sp.]|nr:hypothetical protein [Croceibacter sp.]